MPKYVQVFYVNDYFLFRPVYFLVHFSSLQSLVTSNAGIVLFRHHVINLGQSQCVLTFTVSGTPTNQVNQVGTFSDRSYPSCQSLTHSQSLGAAQETDRKRRFPAFGDP
ncbi:hypothetical protein QQF64_008069 [Cirrhinus molitorella]|uniref:Uncharacterized protein n=1 Tax=Cirrhinus molitorella TaxID=172907 RepID=A0ABR3M533_9TELE